MRVSCGACYRTWVACPTDGPDLQAQWGEDYISRETGRVEEGLKICLEWVAAAAEDQPMDDKEGEDDSDGGASGQKPLSVVLWTLVREAEAEFGPLREGYLEEMAKAEAEAEEGQDGDEGDGAEGQGEEECKTPSKSNKENAVVTAE